MMKKLLLFVFSITLISVYAQDNGFNSKWSNGHIISSADKNFKLKFGGRIMYDMAFMDHGEVLDAEFGEVDNGVEFRRVRLFSSGSIYSNIKYKLQLDFAGGKVTFKDVFIQLNDIPVVGSFRVGHFKEPFRLEVLMSSKYMSLMERSYITAFSPERNSGMMFLNEVLNKRIGWQFGVFRNGDALSGNDKNTGSNYNITGRISGLLVKNAENSRIFHLGIGFTHRSPVEDTYKVSFRPASHLAPKYLSTSFSGLESVDMVNFEMAAVLGPLAFQGEFLVASFDQALQESNVLTSSYMEVSYFLTGEHRLYKNSFEGFGRVKPRKNYGKDGWGALELAIRYDNVNLTEVNSGEMSDIAFGLNWYLNPVTRVMVNYVYAGIDADKYNDIKHPSIFQTRFQIDF